MQVIIEDPEVYAMAGRKSIFQRIRLVYRRSSTALKLLVLSMVVFCTVALIVLGVGIHHTKTQTEQMRQQAAQLEQENSDLEERISELGSVQSVIRIAREMLGLEDPDTVIIDPVESTDPQ